MVIDPNRAPSWKSTPNSLRTSSSRLRPSVGMFSSPTQISPRSGVSRPMRLRRRTDLPLPEGPMTVVIRPRGKSIEMSSRTVFLPKDLVRPRTEMTGSSTTVLPG
jgi:hypothetical protein